MRIHHLLIACLTVMTLAIASTHAALLTTDVYDPTGDGSNDIDTEATGNDITLSAFRTLVDTAYDDDAGGVINFDELSDQDLGTGFAADYGTNGTETLTVTAGTNNDTPLSNAGWFVRDPSASAGAISNDKVLRGAHDWDFDFDTGLTAVAITFIERNSKNPTVVATIELQDGTRTEKFNATASDDTFFAYTASASNPIVSLEIATGDYHEVDELGFVIVPEPATLALLGLGGAVMLAGRKRRA